MTAHDDLLALLRSSVETVYDQDVYSTPEYPYVLVTGGLPAFPDRSLSRSPHGRRVSWLLTPAGQSRQSVSIMSNRVIDLLEGARISGQRLEYEPTGVDIEEEENLTVNSLPVFFSKLTFSMSLPI